MLGKRLIELYEELKSKNILKTKQEFSTLLRIEYKNLSKYFRDELKYEVNQQNYDNLNLLGINLGWLLTGQGEMFKDGIEIKSPKDIDKEKKEEEEKERLRKEIEELKKQLESEKKMVEELDKEIRDLKDKNLELSQEVIHALKERLKIGGNNNLNLNHT
ncbi:MAG TPA: hypothetical protein PK771_04615 [Spirochaetota bacterium]|nr:hypothetical protein [Spirochaetota bacterium]